MTDFEDLKEEIAGRFDIGRKSGVLLQDAMSYLSNYPGGLSGFLNKLISTGQEEKVTSWVRDPYPMALSPAQVKRTLGNETIAMMAKKLGLRADLTCRMLAIAIPKMIALLTKDPSVRESVLGLLPGAAGAARPRSERPQRGEGRPDTPRGAAAQTPARKLVLPGAAAAATIGLFSYAIVAGTASDRAFYAPAVHEAAYKAPAQPPDGFAVSAGWTQNLAAEFGLGGGRDAALPPSAQASQLVEAMPASRAFALGTLASERLPQFVVASAAGSLPPGGGMRLAAAAPAASHEAAAPRKEEAIASAEAALRSFTIHFPPNSARVPAKSLPELRRAAELMKELPSGTVVDLKGYTARTANPKGDIEFSERRAQAVYHALVEAGADPAMLRPQGFGSPELAAGEEAGPKEGRSSAAARPRPADRRVEFHIVPPA